jgi:formate dehydrogenase subunit delta
MSHTETEHGSANLVKMANDIAHFYAAYVDEEEGRREAASHLRKFWAAPMRKALFEHIDAHGAESLEPFMRGAVLGARERLLEGTQAD